MSPLSISRIISAIVAVIVLFGGFLMNSARHGPPVINAALDLPAALGQGEIGSRMREIYSLANTSFIGKDWPKSELPPLMNPIGKSDMNSFPVIRSREKRA